MLITSIKAFIAGICHPMDKALNCFFATVLCTNHDISAYASNQISKTYCHLITVTLLHVNFSTIYMLYIKNLEKKTHIKLHILLVNYRL